MWQSNQQASLFPRKPAWVQSKEKADQYAQQVVEILSNHGRLFIQIGAADMEADQRRATDFVVKVVGGDIACRIRGSQYWPDPGDVTFRYSRLSGVTTEVAKIIAGYARWMFYAWGDTPRDPFVAWVLIDLDTVRSNRVLQQAIANKHIKGNKDGGSEFVYVAIPDLGAAIVARGGQAEKVDPIPF